MDLTLLLADSAEVAENKLFVLGAGWGFTGPDAAGPMAVAALVEVAWDEANVPHPWTLELHDEDGRPVVIPPGDAPLRVEGLVEVGRPPGHPVGAPLTVPLALNFGPMPLAAGRYEWVMTLDGEGGEVARRAFSVRGTVV